MPELPEVEAICRHVRRETKGVTVLEVHVVRTHVTKPQSPDEVERLASGRTIQNVSRVGKNILLELSGDVVLHIHLRMTGNLRVIDDYRLRPLRINAWFRLGDNRALVFEDPRALGTMRIVDKSVLLRDVGIEPLSKAFTIERLIDLARRSRQPAKIFLMNQRHIAGLGNIYAAEALHRAGIDPRKPLNHLRKDRLAALHQAIETVLHTAVKSASVAYRKPGRFAEDEWYPVAVYGREGEPCPRCRRPVKRIPQGGRSTYFCPGCQR